MILRRLRMPACRSLGNSRRSCSTPSTRQRTLSMSSRGSRWMSEACMLAASASRLSTISMMVASMLPPPASAAVSPFSSRASLSLPRELKWRDTASSKLESVQITGTTRFLVRMPTSSMEMTSSGLVMASTRPPLSSIRSGMSRRRMMKSRGSRPMAPASGTFWARSATPMRICPATAVTMSCSLTIPRSTRMSPRRPPFRRWRSRASSSSFWSTRPLATSRVPSLRRPAARCVRPLMRLLSL